jgi:hypothetical protein
MERGLLYRLAALTLLALMLIPALRAQEPARLEMVAIETDQGRFEFTT